MERGGKSCEAIFIYISCDSSSLFHGPDGPRGGGLRRRGHCDGCRQRPGAVGEGQPYPPSGGQRDQADDGPGGPGIGPGPGGAGHHPPGVGGGRGLVPLSEGGGAGHSGGAAVWDAAPLGQRWGLGGGRDLRRVCGGLCGPDEPQGGGPGHGPHPLRRPLRTERRGGLLRL